MPGKEVMRHDKWPLGRRQVKKEVREMSLGPLSFLSATASPIKPPRMHDRPLDLNVMNGNVQQPRGRRYCPCPPGMQKDTQED